MSYEQIAKYTGTSATGTFSGINFNTLPTTYKHLMVIAKLAMQTNTPTAATVKCRFNNDSTNGNYVYCFQGARNNPSADSGASNSVDAATCIGLGRPASNGDVDYGAFTYYIPNFSGTGKKTWQVHTSSVVPDINPVGENRIWHQAGYWNSTAAITSLNFSSDTSPNFASFTDISVYGLKDS